MNKAYYDLVNEGGEGYTPYNSRYNSAKKQVSAPAQPAKKYCFTSLPQTADQLIAKLAILDRNTVSATISDAGREINAKNATELRAFIAANKII